MDYSFREFVAGGSGKYLISDIFGYTILMQEETLTFEEIQELRSRRESGEYVPAEVMEAYFTMKAFLESKDVAKV